MRISEKCSHGFCNLVLRNVTGGNWQRSHPSSNRRANQPYPFGFQSTHMNGADVARAIKTNTRTAHIPIVGWSAYFGEHWREEALRAGMVAYMEKPLSVPVIEATIKQFILAD